MAQRWLIEFTDPAALLRRLATPPPGLRVVSAVPDARFVVVEASPAALADFLGDAHEGGVFTQQFSPAAVRAETDSLRQQVMAAWNESFNSAQTPRGDTEGLSWDAPGFLPP